MLVSARARPSAVDGLRGPCGCGAITYVVEDRFEYALICHCSRCRAATGSGSKPFGGVPIEALAVHAQDGAVLRVGDDEGHDVRCGRCGSLLYSLVRDGAYAHVTYGSLLDVPSLALEHHIYVGSKAHWETIADGLPQWHELPG